MLDIVFVGHRPNFTRLAHRGVAVQGRTASTTVQGTLPSAVDLVGVPGKVILSLEGGKHQDFEPAEAYLQSQSLPWQIVHAEEVTSYYEAMMRGLEKCQNHLVTIIPAWIGVTDKKWIQRMIWALGKDATALLVSTQLEQGGARDLAPYPVNPRKWPGGEWFVARREKLIENLRLCNMGVDDFKVQLANAMALNGWRMWSHPGVRFNRYEHEDHVRKTPSRTPAGEPATGSPSQ